MNVGRPIQYDPEIALNNAMCVFWQQGYSCTSLDDLLKAMKLSKSSFYQTFKGKHELFLNCISHYLKVTRSEFTQNLNQSSSGKQFICDLFEKAVEEGKTNPRGCLVSNTATEFAQSDERVTKLIKKSLNTYKGIFKKAVIKGQNDGSINKDIDPDSMAGFLVTNLNGLRTMVKAGINRKTLRGMVRMIVNTMN